MWAKQKQQSGFTIVELLIVIVVIGILAAITIVAYNGIQTRARGAAASSGLTQASKKIAIAMNDGTLSAYPVDQAGFNALNITSSNVDYQYKTTTTGYCITATAGNVSYKITEASSPTSGACPGHGSGGVAAVTNLVTNPSFAISTANWAGASATVSRVTSPWSADANGALQVTATGQDSYGYVTIPVQAGATYTILATLHLEAAQTAPLQGPSQQRNIFASFIDSSGTHLGSGGAISSVPSNTAGTYQLRTSGVAPTNTTYLRIRLYNGAASGTVYWDQVMVVAGTYSGAYGDGTSNGWDWIGTANNSTSTGPPL